jgi:hypothetical protein
MRKLPKKLNQNKVPASIPNSPVHNPTQHKELLLKSSTKRVLFLKGVNTMYKNIEIAPNMAVLD